MVSKTTCHQATPGVNLRCLVSSGTQSRPGHSSGGKEAATLPWCVDGQGPGIHMPQPQSI